MLSIPEEASYVNLIKDISKKKVPENPPIWLTTWWTCKAVWWKVWKETSWWWPPQSLPSFGSTLSSQDFFPLKFLSHSHKSSNPWLNQESILKILTLVMYQELLSISWLCLVWDKSIVYFWNKITQIMKLKINLLKSQELLQEEWEEILWWEVTLWWVVEWWGQEWWTNHQIKINNKKTFLNHKFNLWNWSTTNLLLKNLTNMPSTNWNLWEVNDDINILL